MIPEVRRVAILFYPEHPGQHIERAYSEETAQRLGIVLIPSLAERDSRRGFPRRGEYDSPWQTRRRGLPWRLRFEFAGITRPRKYACWRSGLRMPLRRGACWRWRRSMTAGLAPKPPRSAVLGCKRCGTGYYLSTPRDHPAW